MPSTINLRRKIRSITNTKQITRAMQMVAASKMRKAQEAVLNSRSYDESGQLIMRLIRAVLSKEQRLSHPLFDWREGGRVTLVVIGSDRGLAGGYNANILRKTLEFLKTHKEKEVRIVTIGRKIQDSLSRIDQKIEASFVDFPSRPVSGDVVPIARLTIEAFAEAETDKVALIYTKFHSTLRQEVVETVLLPVLDEPTSEEKSRDYLFEPNAAIVLAYIVPRLIETRLLQAILDATASEHSSRMLAMKSATDNANDLIEDLKLTYNSVRQATITKELAEISAASIS